MRDRARNSIHGRKAQQAGDSLEALVTIQHDIALRLGILAHVDKINPPAEVRNGRLQFGPRTGSDWVGMLGGGGAKYYACEAKSTAKEYLPRSEVSPKQQAHLDVVARGGGLALLVVRFTGEPDEMMRGLLGWDAYDVVHRQHRIYAVPWSEIKWQVLRSAESVSEERLRIGGWVVRGQCFLERFHPRGVPLAAAAKGRFYPRE